MRHCGFRSVYSLYLATDLPRATVDRWLSGRVRIPISGAKQLIDLLLDYRDDVPALLLLKRHVADAERVLTPEERLRAELTARRVPVQRTLAALRAVNLFPLLTEDQD